MKKQSLVNGLYLSGLRAPGFYAPEGSDPSADLTGWRDRLEAGEPYGADVQAILDEITTNHSSYYIDHSIEPAPMLMSSGFTDDLFPADETIRYYNRTKDAVPATPTSRSSSATSVTRARQNKADVVGALGARDEAWFDYYVKGEGAEPAAGRRGLHARPARATRRPAAPISARAGRRSRPARSATRDPADEDDRRRLDDRRGSSTRSRATPAHTAPDDDPAGAATYRLDAAPASGYTLLGRRR